MATKGIVTRMFRAVGLRKSKTVAWSLLLVLAPALMVAASTMYLQGEYMAALVGAVAALLAGLLFIASFLAEIPLEEDLNEWTQSHATDEAVRDALEEAVTVLEAGGYELDIDEPDELLTELARIIAREGDE